MVQDQLVALYAKRQASDAERAKRGLAPLPRPDLAGPTPATPTAPATVTPVRTAAPPIVTPVRATPTAADLEFERVRSAALARIAAEKAAAAEIDKAVTAILEARDLALNL